MENSRKNERFSLDAVANAIKDGIFNEVGDTKSMDYFAEVNTDFDYDEYRNTLDSEREKIDKKIQLLEQKRSLIDGWWKGIEYYRDALDKAYEKIRLQENDNVVLKRQLAEEQKRREKHERMSARLMEITKEDAELKVQLTAQRELFESTARQLAEEKRQKADLEMKLTELNKLMAGVAKKASEEVLLKTIQSYVNKSKQKGHKKRAAAKEWALEMVLANKLNVPEELAEAIEHLDDVQAGPRTVVNGDLVQSKHVENEVKNVASGATGVTINKKQA